MNFYEFAIPTQIDGAQLKAHLGCDELYIRDDKLVVGSETLTLDQATTGIASYIFTVPINVAVEVQQAADKASGIAKLVALGLTQAQATAVSG